MNTTTRRYARSIREAFGPYARDVIEAAGSDKGQRLADRLILVLCTVASLVLLGIAVAEILTH